MKEFYINDDGIRLHCKLDLPQTDKEKFPLVIIIHGFTGNMEERHIIAVQKEFNYLGMAALRVDMYGHGKSGGQFRDHTILKWISNILTVTNYARKLDFVSDLYLCGHSQGGLLTIMAAGLRPDQYKAIIPMSPALVIPDAARKGNSFGLQMDPGHYPDEISLYGRTLSGDYFRTAALIHAEDCIRQYNKPVLIVHGEKDEAVPISYSKQAQQLYENCCLTVIPDDDHGYSLHLEMVLDAIREFLS